MKFDVTFEPKNIDRDFLVPFFVLTSDELSCKSDQIKK